MKKILFILTILTTFLFSNTDKKITLQLNWLHQFQFAGYYMAKEKGFYKDVNLDVNIKEFVLDTNILEEIKNKNADFSIGRSSLLIEKINGEDIIALAAIFQQSPLVLLVKKDANINNVKDLKNKKIMLTKDASYSASILAMLSANGLKPNEYEIQKHTFNIEDLISGKTDAMASYLSNEPILLKERKIESTVFYPKDFGFDFYSDILFTSSGLIKNNPKLTKDFYNASIKGWAYAFENLTESAEIIHSKYNTQNKSFVNLVKEGEVLKKLAYADNKGLGHISESKLNDIVSIFKIFGLVKKDINLKDFIYDGNPHKTISIEISKQEKRYIFLILIFLLIIITLSIYSFSKNRQMKKLLHTVINSTDDLIFYKNSELKYIGCNKSFEELVGKKEAELIGKNDFQIFEDEFAQILSKNDERILNSKLEAILMYDEWLIIDDKKSLFQIKKTPFAYGKNNNKGVLAISRDITTLNKIQEKLKEQAYFDELTEIYNRKAYNERIQEKFDLHDRYQTDFCIAMYDIDDFKNINDNYGHDIGDKVLKELTSEIKSLIRKTDLLFRVGGEEFIIIFPKTLIEEAYPIVEKIRINVSEMKIVENEKITISIGITQTKMNDTPILIYERVDKLMYKSKHNNKNQTTKD